MLWIKHSLRERMTMLQRAEEQLGMSLSALEKDWWVTVVLKALSECSCKSNLIFKGGTSLSKGWGLIARFSEDIDLSIGHDFFSIEKTNKSQLEKLRKKARRYITDVVAREIEEGLKTMGIKGFEVEPVTQWTDQAGNTHTIDSDKDPTVILVHYNSIYENNIDYIPPRVKVEVSCLSMNEPTELRNIRSFVEQTFPGEDDDATTTMNTVLPTRTFLEKAFLLCEEFQKQKPRHVRMSRHLYDLEQMMDTPFGQAAIADKKLYERIVEHRKTYYNLRYVDYSMLRPSSISFIPPMEIQANWKHDYEEMTSHFIYGSAPSFEHLMARIVELQRRFREMEE